MRDRSRRAFDEKLNLVHTAEREDRPLDRLEHPCPLVFSLRQRAVRRKVEITDAVFSARRDHRKILRKERNERIVLRPLRKRFEQRVHARLPFVEGKGLLLGAQFAARRIPEVERNGDRPQTALT